MKRLVLAFAAAMFVSAPPAPVSASRCFERASEYQYGADACAKRPIPDRSFLKTIPIAKLETGIPPAAGESDASFIRARAHFDGGAYDRAIADYDAAIRLKPDAAGAYVNRGNAYAEKGEFARAVTDYDTAIRLNPHFALAYINRGLVAVKQDLLEWALRDFARAYDLDVRPRWLVDVLRTHGRLP